MAERGTGDSRAGPARGRGAVAASILAVVLIGGYFAAAPDTGQPIPAEFVVNAVIMVLVFWFPAMKVGSPRDVLAQWKTLLPWLLAWTLVWDLASSGVVGGRELLEEWYLVYPSGVITILLLLLFHGLVVQRVGAGREESD
jgi:hypothetical protein